MAYWLIFYWILPGFPLSSQRHLRSAERNLLHVPRHRLNTYGRRAFAIAGPSIWSSLLDPVCNPPELLSGACRKHYCSHGTSTPIALGRFACEWTLTLMSFDAADLTVFVYFFLLQQLLQSAGRYIQVPMYLRHTFYSGNMLVVPCRQHGG